MVSSRVGGAHCGAFREESEPPCKSRHPRHGVKELGVRGSEFDVTTLSVVVAPNPEPRTFEPLNAVRFSNAPEVRCPWWHPCQHTVEFRFVYVTPCVIVYPGFDVRNPVMSRRS